MRKVFYTGLVIFLLADMVFSFIQHAQFSLDGDMPGIIMPSESYQKVMNDPFGLNVLFHDSVYANPNRFFAHWVTSKYFKTVPELMQAFTNPIDSIYYACALAKTGIQFFIIFLLAAYISGKRNLLHRDFLLAAVLITPLFQAFGYNGIMGIIDRSVSYTFFYAFALSLVLLFFLPFFYKEYHKQPVKFNYGSIFLMLLLAVVISFNGALNPAVILIVCPFVLIYMGYNYLRQMPERSLKRRVFATLRQIPRVQLVLFVFVSLLSLYSLYIGRNNAEHLWASISLSERYARLPLGLYYQLTNKPGPPLLLLMIIVNLLIIHRRPGERSQFMLLAKWIGILAAIYILLLPLGGYREYRPFIIRRDTFMPVFFALFFLYGITSLHIIRHLKTGKYFYYLGLMVFLLIFIHTDAKIVPNNRCEKKALKQIAHSPDSIVVLNDDCTVLSWEKIEDYRHSFLQSELLEHWNVIERRKLYYQE